MKEPLCRCIVVTAVVMVPIILLSREKPSHTTRRLTLEEEKMVAWQRDWTELKASNVNYPLTFKDLQKNSEPLKDVSSQVLSGPPPLKNKHLQPQHQVQVAPNTHLYRHRANASSHVLNFSQDNYHVEESPSVEEKKANSRQMVEKQLSSESRRHGGIFQDMQDSPSLQHASFRILAGSLPSKRKLLTVGIASGQQPQESGLVDTLRSLFQMASPTELSDVVVLAHLLSPDPKWLSQTLAQVSRLFKPHIEAQRLLVIQGALDDTALSGDTNRTTAPSACEALDSRQKTGYALLMHFASSLSDYFLLIGDRVHCTPNFVTTMYGALQAWEEQPWTTLEFSSLSFSGKVFHASDLSRLASFLLLFQGAPTDRLLSEFRLLSNQNVPIRLSPSLFQHVGNFSQLEDACFSMEREKVFGDPDNPSGSVITDMFALLNTLPQDAYTLGEDYFFTYDPVRGNHLTVVLEEPQKVTRIEVLTGSAEDGTHHLQLGQIELGSDPMGQPRDCVRYVLLGPLVQGNLDQRVFYEEEDSVKKMSCIRLLALGSEQSWLVIRKIKVWMESG